MNFPFKEYLFFSSVLRDFLSDAIKVLTSIEIRVTGIEEVERGMDYNQFFANWEVKILRIKSLK